MEFDVNKSELLLLHNEHLVNCIALVATKNEGFKIIAKTIGNKVYSLTKPQHSAQPNEMLYEFMTKYCPSEKLEQFAFLFPGDNTICVNLNNISEFFIENNENGYCTVIGEFKHGDTTRLKLFPEENYDTVKFFLENILYIAENQNIEREQ
ncbi:MAG: hypothetical protein IJA69_00580 [Clostridia bacterium]|nr:hypothetical protein [Clostridia bacterium]